MKIKDRVVLPLGASELPLNYKLVRERDGLTKQSYAVKWIEWNGDGTYKETHLEPSTGYSLIMSPFNISFT